MTSIKNCLIIDDDPEDQEILTMCVHQVNKNITCLEAGDGVKALAMLQSNVEYTPDYIFLDVNMPKMNGVDCLKELKKIKRLGNTKIYMYSTTSESKILVESKLLGANDFIVKPSNVNELKKKLYSILELTAEM